MIPALAVVAVLAVAAVAGVVLGRRRKVAAPTQPRAEVPSQLDRRDFERPDAPWLVVVFSSATCGTCADVVAKARALDSAVVAVQDVEFGAARDLHERYGIDAVPIVAVADGQGVVRAGVAGPVSATDLWAMVAEARDPGSTPRHEGCAAEEPAPGT